MTASQMMSASGFAARTALPTASYIAWMSVGPLPPQTAGVLVWAHGSLRMSNPITVEFLIQCLAKVTQFSWNFAAVTVPLLPVPSVPSVPGPVSNHSPFFCCAAFSQSARVASLLWLSKITFNPAFLHAATNASSCSIAPGSPSVRSIQSTRTQLNPMPRIAATWPSMPLNGPASCSRSPTTFIPVSPTLAMRTEIPSAPTIWLPRVLRNPAGSEAPVDSLPASSAVAALACQSKTNTDPGAFQTPQRGWPLGAQPGGGNNSLE